MKRKTYNESERRNLGMEPITQNSKNKNLLYMLGGLGGISLVIIIHECGHFLFAKLFGVPTPLFSLGFGPALIKIPFGETIFQIALLPIGGYVEMNPQALAAQPYAQQMIIILAGILFNLLFAYGILWYYAKEPKQIIPMIRCVGEATAHIMNEQKQTSRLIGPIGIIHLIGKSIAISAELFWLILAMISLNIGLFNLIPLPFFDGGRAVILTIEVLTGRIASEAFLWNVSLIFLSLLMLLMCTISFNDIKQLIGKK